MKIAMVSGHRDLTPEEFHQHYAQRLNQAIEEGDSFVVGDAEGCDMMTQAYLRLRSPAHKFSVTVYHKGRLIRYHNSFPTKGGYRSQTAKDRAMTEASDYDIAWVRPGREDSGTARNLARRK